MIKTGCKFCEALDRYKRVEATIRDYEPEVSFRLSAAIVRRKFIKGRRGCQSSFTDYRNKGCGYELNYCPECGRDLRKKG